MKKVVVGGVPEHFNLPWHLAIEEGLFKAAGIDLEWVDFPGGTGAMCQALRNKEVDIAVLLTEGIVADIIKGNPSKIISSYTDSPLTWGIFVSAASDYQKIDDLEGKTYAISRFGSGSHMMAYVDAQMRGWSTEDLKFKVCGGIEGARVALKDGSADLFLWEQFITMPLVQSGEFRLVGRRMTPWPCFAMAVPETILSKEAEALTKIVNIIRKSADDFEHRLDALHLIMERYGLTYEDADSWYFNTDWSDKNHLTPQILEQVMGTLLELDRIDHKVDSALLTHDLNK